MAYGREAGAVNLFRNLANGLDTQQRALLLGVRQVAANTAALRGLAMRETTHVRVHVQTEATGGSSYDPGAFVLSVVVDVRPDKQFQVMGAVAPGALYHVWFIPVQFRDEVEYRFDGAGGRPDRMTPFSFIATGGAAGDASYHPGAVRQLSASAALAAGDSVVYVNASGGPVTVTLPAPGSAYDSATGRTRQFTVKKVDPSANAVTVIAAGAAQVEFAPSQTLAAQGTSVTYMTNGVAYFAH